jgi:DNA repair protein RadC
MSHSYPPNPPATALRQLADDDRPREKLLLKGRGALSDAELLAVLIGSGTPRASALDIGRQLLGQVECDLHRLGRMSVADLCKMEGIGQAKALSIVCALELGRRRLDARPKDLKRISCADDAYQLMKPELLDLNHEEFWVILLSRANDILRKVKISSGGVSGTVADPKLIFKAALDQLASSLILVHNHPSGNLQPSHADIQLTKKLRAGGELLEVSVLDHVIFTDRGFFSFNDEGMM